MKIVLWIGNEANQKALANKIHSRFPLSGIITETRIHKNNFSISKILEKVFEKVSLSSIGKAWWGMKEHYEKRYPSYPDTSLLDVENINSAEAYDFTKNIAPDLIIVSGTRLVKERMLSIAPSIGILNLHTGLSPYVKGGPNCTNWCVATKQFHLIGNTIMWIDAGIDTGNLVTTAFTELTGDEDLPSLHLKVMEHAHSLYVDAIDFLAKGGTSNVKQSAIAEGITYYTREWGLQQKIALARNSSLLKSCVASGELAKKRSLIKTVKI